jgi:hypothetical protein
VGEQGCVRTSGVVCASVSLLSPSPDRSTWLILGARSPGMHFDGRNDTTDAAGACTPLRVASADGSWQTPGAVFQTG